jgi:hypothetical protein
MSDDSGSPERAVVKHAGASLSEGGWREHPSCRSPLPEGARGSGLFGAQP